MGIIIAKFRKKKSTYEILEKLEKEITEIEEFSRTTEKTKKKIVGRFIVLAFFTYFLLALALYFCYHRISSYQKLLYTTPLIAVPIITYIIRGFLTWYYSRKIRKNQSKLIKLQEEKKKILENVEETETYKVAKQILDKFGDQSKKPTISIVEATPLLTTKSASVSSISRPMVTGLRQRTVGPPTVKGRLPFGLQEMSSTPLGSGRMATPSQTPAYPMRAITAGYSATPGPVRNMPSTLQLPRPIMPPEKTILDKMFNYLVGDGLSNRYALICQNCSNHNGMALKEEFEYLSFRCCYCGFFNPSRKKRPSGPKFEPKLSPSRTLTTQSSDSDVSSGESDDSSKPVITEITSDVVLDDTERRTSISEMNDNRTSPIEINNLINETRDSGISQIGLQESGDSQTDNAQNQSYETHLNPFEDQNRAGDERNPFTDEDIEKEALGGTPMDYETIDGSEVVGTQDNDLINRQETKED